MQWEGVVGRIGFTFLPSWATFFAVVQPAVSPSPAAPLCWVFCLCPKELVGPAGLCAQVLGRRCRCGPWQAIRPLISQSSSFVLPTHVSGFVPERHAASGSSGFVLGKRAASRSSRLGLGGRSSCPGLESLGRAGRPGTESCSTGVRGFGPVSGAASLCSRCSPT